MNTNQAAYFKTLINFLKELPTEKFDFRQVVSEYVNGCGTVCCAAGWCAELFPAVIGLVKEGGVWSLQYKGVSGNSNYSFAMSKLFGITQKHARILFCAYSQKEKIDPSFDELTFKATPKQVAALLETYLAKFYPEHV